MMPTIAWQSPAALWWLLLLAAPVVIHLLRSHQADRVPFPSLRFVRPSRTAAIRMRGPSDVILLLLRMAIVGLAVCALAGPIVLTPSRLATWNALVARAIVVDRSRSMDIVGDRERAPSAVAADRTRSEQQSAAYHRRFDAASLQDGVRRAIDWLAAAPPARRELVVISDFQRGSFDQGIATTVPESVGLHLVSVGRAQSKRVVPGFELYGVEGVPRRTQTIALTTEGTSVVMTPAPSSPSGGLRFADPKSGTDQAGRTRDVSALVRAVAQAGTPAPSPDQPIVVSFAGDGAIDPADLAPIKSGWMLSTVLRLRQDPVLAQMAGGMMFGASSADPFVVVARDREQDVRVRAAGLGRELLLEVSSAPDSLLSAAAVRAVLEARHGSAERPEEEPARIPSTELAAWMRARPGTPVGQDAWRNAASTDGRWFWAAVLLLLGIEQWVRGKSTAGITREIKRAAA
jgi:Aerotolerance regulator N-terminal